MEYVKIICLAVLSLAISGCDNIGPTPAPKTLRVSVLPDQNKTALQQRYEPLLKYLGRETGIHFELVFADDYQKLLDGFHNKNIDIARFGGLTYLDAHLNDNAQPLVMRDVDTRFISYYLVAADNPAQSISDFKGKSFSFGSKLSTSGHLMPRHFLAEQNIIPETFFSDVLYSGAHDTTVNWVKQGKVALGVANSDVVKRMYAKGDVSKQQVRILSQTPPYADYVWAVQADLPAATAEAILDAFLKLSFNNPEHTKILMAVGAQAYLPAVESEFSSLASVATELGLLKTRRH